MSSQAVHAILNLTTRCNQNCVFCCDGDLKQQKSTVPLAEVKAKLEGFRQVGADRVILIGGEPTVRRDFIEICRMARGLGLEVSLTTNGLALADPDYLSAIVEAGVSHIELSFHHFRSPEAEQISRNPKTVRQQRRALENLRPLVAAGTVVANLNVVIFSGNYRVLPELVRHLHREHPFVDDLYFNFVDPVGYSRGSRDLVPRYREVQPYLREALGEALQRTPKVSTDNVPLCILGRFLFTARPTLERLRGVLYAKQTHDVVDLAPEDDTSQYEHPSPCHACNLEPLCVGVSYRYLELHGPGDLAPERRPALEVLTQAVPPRLDLPVDLAHLARSLPDRREVPHHPVVLTTRCNNRCPTCPFSLDNRVLGDDEIGAQLQAGRDAGCEAVAYTGGEPTLHPGLVGWVRRARDLGFQRVRLETNGRMLGYPALVRKLLAAGLTEARVSLHAGDPASHDARVQAEGAFAQTMNGLESLLAARRCAVTVRLPLDGETVGHLSDLVPRLHELGVRDFYLEPTPGLAPRAEQALTQEAARLAAQLAASGTLLHLP